MTEDEFNELEKERMGQLAFKSFMSLAHPMSGSWGVITNRDGSFKIPIPEPYKANVSTEARKEYESFKQCV